MCEKDSIGGAKYGKEVLERFEQVLSSNISITDLQFDDLTDDSIIHNLLTRNTQFADVNAKLQKQFVGHQTFSDDLADVSIGCASSNEGDCQKWI